jgi:hypothetical protein
VAAGPKIAIQISKTDSRCLAKDETMERPTSTIQSHATRSGKVMLLETFAINCLLSEHVTATEKHLSQVRNKRNLQIN